MPITGALFKFEEEAIGAPGMTTAGVVVELEGEGVGVFEGIFYGIFLVTLRRLEGLRLLRRD
jgi:hypothetical protein